MASAFQPDVRPPQHIVYAGYNQPQNRFNQMVHGASNVNIPPSQQYGTPGPAGGPIPGSAPEPRMDDFRAFQNKNTQPMNPQMAQQRVIAQGQARAMSGAAGYAATQQAWAMQNMASPAVSNGQFSTPSTTAGEVNPNYGTASSTSLPPGMKILMQNSGRMNGEAPEALCMAPPLNRSLVFLYKAKAKAQPLRPREDPTG